MRAAMAKGTRFESDIERYFNENETVARRNPRAGVKDIGDVSVDLRNGFEAKGALVVEAKARRDMNLSEYVKEAADEATNFMEKYKAYEEAFPVAIVKRRQKSTHQSYVVMELHEFMYLLKWAGVC